MARLIVLAAALFGAYLVVHALALPMGVQDVTYDTGLFLCALVCALRGRRERRPAWWLMAAGLAVWTCGDLYYDIALALDGEVPIPSPADLGYLALYPLWYAGLVLLLREQVPERPAATWLDGLVGALAAAAVAAAVVVEAVAENLGGDPLANAVNLAYPLADSLLLALAVTAMALLRWRPGRSWLFIAGGLGVFALADGVYLYTVATGSYDAGLQDMGWPLAALLVALGAAQPAVLPAQPGEAEEGRALVLPLLFGLGALAVLVLDHYERVNELAMILATSGLLALMARLAITFGEKNRLHARTRTEALTDALTGLPNRRRLTSDLDRALRSGDPHLLLLFDLNGFKPYNDSFGHPAGDALLARLGRTLAEACGGGAYRMGGDEFCALLPLGPDADADALTLRAADALSAHGEVFSITASWGRVRIPEEAGTAGEALGEADRRMYAQKHAHRPSAGRQSTDVLLRVLEERNPELGDHGRNVSVLAGLVAARLGLPDDEREQIEFAAELHDVGKVAVPDAILGKPGPLDEDEWAFIRRHTLIGERIVTAAPALKLVARLVRSSHERWDGAGYPDGLAGPAIPLGSRIVAVCDAWEAMVSERPYRAPRPAAAAREELRAHAGGQFDPAVVEAFLVVERERAREAARVTATLEAI